MEFEYVRIESSKDLLKIGRIYQCVCQAIETWKVLSYLFVGSNQLLKCVNVVGRQLDWGEPSGLLTQTGNRKYWKGKELIILGNDTDRVADIIHLKH